MWAGSWLAAVNLGRPQLLALPAGGQRGVEGSGWHCAVGQGDREVTSDLRLLSTFSSTLPFRSLPPSLLPLPSLPLPSFYPPHRTPLPSLPPTPGPLKAAETPCKLSLDLVPSWLCPWLGLLPGTLHSPGPETLSRGGRARRPLPPGIYSMPAAPGES